MNQAQRRGGVETISEVLANLRESEDLEKAHVHVAFFNAYSQCVQKIGGRHLWNVNDWIRFAKVIQLAEEIKPEVPDFGTLHKMEREIKDTVRTNFPRQEE